MKQNYILCILVLYFSTCAAEYSSLVEIYQGKLRGISKTDWKGGKFYSFLSVPYAKQPIGKLRFLIPGPPDKWDGVLDATEDLPPCIQKTWFGKVVGQEDCLYLNVHTPEIKTKNLKPVMVYIHGGGFTEGSGRTDIYGPEFLLPEGIVLVTINYRLGLFGFLNFENPNVGVFGNMGLKDQNMALQWVQKNIEKFGGDPKSVTIFGESAGGASVHMHMISPMSQGLFHKVIAQSGTAMSHWNANGQRNTGVLAAKVLGFQGKSETDMLSFLQDAPIESIFKVTENESIIIPVHKPFIAGPIVEIGNDEFSFLPNRPETLVVAKNYAEVPLMLGFTDGEGILFDAISLLNSGKVQEMPLEETLMNTLDIKDDATRNEILEEIEAFYFEGKEDSDRTNMLNLLGDVWFYWGICNTALTHAKLLQKDLYMYLFSADSQLNYMKRAHPITAKYSGASHIDELGYLFTTKDTPEVKPGSKEAKSIDRMAKLWTNFAKYGNPTPKGHEVELTWKPVEKDTLNYIHIATKNMKMHVNPFAHRLSFWDQLHEGKRPTKKTAHIEL